jgi:hypothetical protein
MSLYRPAEIAKVVAVATAAVTDRQRGFKTMLRAGVQFDLEKGGYCNRFIRQCFEVGLGLAPFDWHFGAASAKETLAKLEPYRIAGATLGQLKPGDIVGWYEGSGPYGHIALFVGGEKGLIAENTSATRGDPKNPGTKVTRLCNVRKGWTAYRLGAV